MGFLENEFIIDNAVELLIAGVVGFVATLFITPLIGRLAMFVDAVDLPASMRKLGDSTASSRINAEPKLKLGGLGILSGLLIAALATGAIEGFNTGILMGLAVVMLTAVMDDKFELSGKFQLLGEFLAASIVVISGISVTTISFLDNVISFDSLSYVIEVGGFTYNAILPADIFTVIWIVSIINIINWVGGVDGLNTSVSSVIAFTMMLFALEQSNLILAIILAGYVGALMGYFPYNYNPSKIIQGASGDLLNGYLLAVFAIVGGTQWSSTVILLGLPIIDALLVIFLRIRTHEKARKNPLHLLSISDKNHLHHRLLSAGYSRKTVLWIEVAIMAVISAIAIYMSEIRRDVVVFSIGVAFIVVTFAAIAYLRNRHRKKQQIESIKRLGEKSDKAIVKVILDENEDREEKFVY